MPGTISVLRSDRSASIIASLLPVGSSLITIPLLARALSAEEFGLWALVMTAVTTLQLLDFGISASVMKFAALEAAAGNEAGAWRYWGSSCAAYLIMTAPIAATTVALPADDFVSKRTDDSAPIILLLFLASAFLAPASNTLIVLLRALGRYRFTVFVVAVGQVAFMGLVMTAFLVGNLSLWTVLAAQAAQFGGVIAAVILAAPRRAMPGLLSLNRVLKLFTFGSQMMGVNLIHAGIMYGPLWATSSLLDPAEAGKFAFASTIAVSVRNLPLMSVTPIFNKLARSGPSAWEVGFREHGTWRRSLLFYLALSVPAAIVGAPIIGGAEYADTGFLTGALIVGYGFGMLTAVLSQLLRLTNLAIGELLAWIWGGAVEAVLLVPAVVVFGSKGAAFAVICGQAVACVAMHRRASRVRVRTTS